MNGSRPIARANVFMKGRAGSPARDAPARQFVNFSSAGGAERQNQRIIVEQVQRAGTRCVLGGTFNN